jgi:23S rRNA (uridine2479-2'-O)-methyltransferase
LFDRPTSPGNIGSIIRSADAFGASGMIVTGMTGTASSLNATNAATAVLYEASRQRIAAARLALTGSTDDAHIHSAPPTARS